MTAEYGIPTWGSYALFAVATILCGLILGLVNRNILQNINPC